MQFAAPLALGASVISGVGQLAQGDAQAKAYGYNASVERQQADEALTTSLIKGQQIDRSNAQAGGAMRAAYGASGVTPQGTALAVMLDQATHGEMNRRLALYQGQLDATGHEEQSDADIASGRAARTASYFGAASTILTGAAQAGKSGMFG